MIPGADKYEYVAGEGEEGPFTVVSSEQTGQKRLPGLYGVFLIGAVRNRRGNWATAQ